MDMSRFKNYGLWLSVAALVPMVLDGFGLKVLPSNYKEITTTVLSILVMGGILNNPTTENQWYKDDTKKIDEDIKKQIPSEVEIKANKADEYYNQYDKVTQNTIDKEKSEK